ncbi:hypothetical protein LLE32_02460 [Neisseria gonorrhoeae]|nr:hypothetical protein LLE32_02460 [Neisseria gonorrhoeae]
MNYAIDEREWFALAENIAGWQIHSGHRNAAPSAGEWARRRFLRF